MVIARDVIITNGDGSDTKLIKKFAQVSLRELTERLLKSQSPTRLALEGAYFVPHFYEVVHASHFCKFYMDIDIPWVQWERAELQIRDLSLFVRYVVWDLLPQVPGLEESLVITDHSAVLNATEEGRKASFHVRIALAKTIGSRVVPHFFAGPRDVKRVIIYLKAKLHKYGENGKFDLLMESVDPAPYGQPTQQIRTIFSCKNGRQNTLLPIMCKESLVPLARLDYDHIRASWVVWRKESYPVSGVQIKIDPLKLGLLLPLQPAIAPGDCTNTTLGGYNGTALIPATERHTNFPDLNDDTRERYEHDEFETFYIMYGLSMLEGMTAEEFHNLVSITLQQNDDVHSAGPGLPQPGHSLVLSAPFETDSGPNEDWMDESGSSSDGSGGGSSGEACATSQTSHSS